MPPLAVFALLALVLAAAVVGAVVLADRGRRRAAARKKGAGTDDDDDMRSAPSHQLLQPGRAPDRAELQRRKNEAGDLPVTLPDDAPYERGVTPSQYRYRKVAPFRSLANSRDERVRHDQRAACLYVFWSGDGTVREHVLCLLESLQAAGYDVYMVSNQQNLVQPLPERLLAATKKVITRENRGYDFGAWREMVFERADEWNASAYDWVLFTNDTVAGPLHGPDRLRDMTLRMRSTGADFWGLTDNDHRANPWHIQSYYWEVSAAVLHSPAFLRCFPSAPVRDKNDVIQKCEVPLGLRLTEEGFTPGVAFPALSTYTRGNSSMWYWDDLVRRGYPLVKHTLQVVDPKDVAFRWKDVIRQYCPEFDMASIASMFGDEARMKYLRQQAAALEHGAAGAGFQSVL